MKSITPQQQATSTFADTIIRATNGSGMSTLTSEANTALKDKIANEMPEGLTPAQRDEWKQDTSRAFKKLREIGVSFDFYGLPLEMAMRIMVQSTSLTVALQAWMRRKFTDEEICAISSAGRGETSYTPYSSQDAVRNGLGQSDVSWYWITEKGHLFVSIKGFQEKSRSATRAGKDPMAKAAKALQGLTPEQVQELLTRLQSSS